MSATCERNFYPDRWDYKFMAIARNFGEWSKCLSRKFGAVLVRDKTVISTGYNGPPRGVPHCNEWDRKEELEKMIHARADIPNEVWPLVRETKGCPRKVINNVSGALLDLCPAGHAERNAISNAARIGVATQNAELFCYCPLPCFECAKTIINAGISRIVCLEGDYDSKARWLFNKSKIRIKQIKEKEIDDYRNWQDKNNL